MASGCDGISEMRQLWRWDWLLRYLWWRGLGQSMGARRADSLTWAVVGRVLRVRPTEGVVVVNLRIKNS